MDYIKKYISTLRPALQKMACLYAYIGGNVTDEDEVQLSVHGACMMGELQIMEGELIRDGIVRHDHATSVSSQQRRIFPRVYGEVMRFGLEEHPEWFEEFDSWPLSRYTLMQELQRNIRSCHEGKGTNRVILDSSLPPYLVALAHVRKFEPLINLVRDVDFPAFITAVIKRWLRDDYVDVEGMIYRQLQQRRLDHDSSDVRSLKALFNYYVYISQGTYTPPSGARIFTYDRYAKVVYAMSKGRCDLCLRLVDDILADAAERSKRQDLPSYPTDGVVCLNWVVAVWISDLKDKRQRLQRFVDEAMQGDYLQVWASVLLAKMLADKHMSLDKEMLTAMLNPQTIAQKQQILQRRLAQIIAARFVNTELAGEDLEPRLAFARHIAADYITLRRGEGKLYTNSFGKHSLLQYVQAVEPWEAMIDRLIAGEEKLKEEGAREEHRVMYLILSDGESVDLREQNRLKDGHWGSGKTLPWNRFLNGTEPYMDRVDQAVVGDVRFAQVNQLTVGIIMPHLVGSDRVYTGEQTPYRRVTIDRQEPYVIMETTDNGFRLQSNVRYQDLLSQHNVYHRDDALHYTYYPMTDHQHAIMRELLSVTEYPAAARDKLKRLLALINTTIEIHSDLIEEDKVNGGRSTAGGEASAILLLRITPDPSSQTMFDVYVLARPLPGGKMTLPPAQGDRVIIDYSETTGRIRLERRMEDEARNLAVLTDFFDSHGITLTSTMYAHMDIPHVLDILSFACGHSDICTVEWPEGERLRMHQANQDSWQLGVQRRSGWFEVEGEVHLDDNSVLTAQQLLAALSASHGGYIQLGEGDFLWLSDRLRKQLDTLESMTHLQDGTPAISTLQAGLLANILHGDIDIQHDESVNEYKQRIEEAEKHTAAVPATLNATLRPYQLEGYQWMSKLAAWGAGACLADDMGLGKTVQTIAFLLSEADNGPALVVSPASVMTNWRNELQKFAPDLHPFVLQECADRSATIAALGPGDVMLLTYGMLPTTRDLLADVAWNIVCLDEAHVIKNRGTKASAACMELRADKRIILTGTPVQNHLGELWNLFQFINPGLLGSYEEFHSRFIAPIEAGIDVNRQTQLQNMVAPFMLRRTKQAVVKDLPEKTEITLYVDLTDDEMAYYEVIRNEAKEKFEEEMGQVSVNTLSELSRLRRTACSTELTNDAWTGGSSKVNTFIELVSGITDGGNSVLVFSQFTSFLNIIMRELDKQGLQYLYLDGSMTIKQRESLVAQFQEGKKPIFLISLKAGGVGLNLTAANYVIHLDPWWNPAIEQQATDRAYRIGQHQAVTVYHLIARHTIEEKILRLHETKRGLAENILEGADQNYKITSKDMLDMLSDNW